MTTHIIQVPEKIESYLQKKIGGKSPSFKTINSYLEYLMAKDMAEHGEDSSSVISRLLSSPEIMEDIRTRYLDRDSSLSY